MFYIVLKMLPSHPVLRPGRQVLHAQASGCDFSWQSLSTPTQHILKFFFPATTLIGAFHQWHTFRDPGATFSSTPFQQTKAPSLVARWVVLSGSPYVFWLIASETRSPQWHMIYQQRPAKLPLSSRLALGMAAPRAAPRLSQQRMSRPSGVTSISSTPTKLHAL